MDNTKLDDIAVLTTLARLRQNDMLGEADRLALEKMLSSDWGKKAAREIFSTEPSHARDILQHYSFI